MFPNEKNLCCFLEEDVLTQISPVTLPTPEEAAKNSVKTITIVYTIDGEEHASHNISGLDK